MDASAWSLRLFATAPVPVDDASAVFVVGDWNHMAVTVSDTGDWRAYVNAVDVTVTPPTITFEAPTVLELAQFVGVIDDVRLYGRCFTAAEVAALYHQRVRVALVTTTVTSVEVPADQHRLVVQPGAARFVARGTASVMSLDPLSPVNLVVQSCSYEYRSTAAQLYVTPSVGPTRGGYLVTIDGGNVELPPTYQYTVYFGGVSGDAPDPLVIMPQHCYANRIIIQVPAHHKGWVDVVIYVDGGSPATRTFVRQGSAFRYVEGTFCLVGRLQRRVSQPVLAPGEPLAIEGEGRDEDCCLRWDGTKCSLVCL